MDKLIDQLIHDLRVTHKLAIASGMEWLLFWTVNWNKTVVQQNRIETICPIN